MRGDARACADAVAAGPAVTREVGILQTPLEPAFFALVDFVPETDSGFEEVLGIAGASAASARRARARGSNFNAATRIVGIRRAVAADAVDRNGCSGQGGIGRLNRSRRGAGLLPNATAARNCRSIDDFDAGVAGVGGTSVVLSAEVAVNIPLWCRVSFDPWRDIAGS